MKITTITFPPGSLASRSQAIIARQEIEGLLFADNTKLHIDLSEVDSISESYSDEVFGVLVLRHGSEHLFKCIQLDNAKQHILASIATVIQRRIKER
jgi:hypothetical protein